MTVGDDCPEKERVQVEPLFLKYFTLISNNGNPRMYEILINHLRPVLQDGFGLPDHWIGFQ